jgi:hypothetical protein
VKDATARWNRSRIPFMDPLRILDACQRPFSPGATLACHTRGSRPICNELLRWHRRGLCPGPRCAAMLIRDPKDVVAYAVSDRRLRVIGDSHEPGLVQGRTQAQPGAAIGRVN